MRKTVQLKACSGCGETKRLEEFGPDRRKLDGRKARCRECLNHERQEYWRLNVDHCRELQRVSSKRYVQKNKEKVYRSIQARNYVVRAGGGTRFDRVEIYERDGGRCHLCGKHVSRARFDLDHLIPVSRDGRHTRDNVAVAHPSCNRSRQAGRLPAQLMLVG